MGPATGNLSLGYRVGSLRGDTAVDDEAGARHESRVWSQADESVDTGTGLCEGSLRRFLHESIKNGSGAQGNHCHRETRNDENAHDLSPAAMANSTHLI